MPKSPIAELVEAALARLPKPYTKDVTHDVFEAIETDPALRGEYDRLCVRYDSGKLTGQHNVNQTIPHWVKTLSGRTRNLTEADSLRSTLIRTYTKLG